MSGALPGQLALFGAQAVHVGHVSRKTSLLVCVACGVSLAMAADWSDCDCCAGFATPVPSWMTLNDAEASVLEEAKAA